MEKSNSGFVGHPIKVEKPKDQIVKVKTFEESLLESLERELNKWLEDNEIGYDDIIETKYQYKHNHYLIIFYLKNKE